MTAQVSLYLGLLSSPLFSPRVFCANGFFSLFLSFFPSFFRFFFSRSKLSGRVLPEHLEDCLQAKEEDVLPTDISRLCWRLGQIRRGQKVKKKRVVVSVNCVKKKITLFFS